MTPIFFDIPDTAVYCWLAVGGCVTAVVDSFARDAGVPPLSPREWLLASITWPLSLFNIAKSFLGPSV